MIRLGSITDITTLGHEVGHELHKLFFGTDDGQLTADELAGQPFTDELDALAQGISDESLSEGWAEFWRRYIDNPEVLPERAPKTMRFVEGRFATDFPAVEAALLKGRELWQLHRDASPQARVRSHQSLQAEPRNLTIQDGVERLRTDVIDDMDPVRRAVEAMSNGEPVDFSDDAYSLARLVRGSMGVGEHFLERGTLDFATNQTNGASLKEVLAPVAEDLDNFRDYIVARRALELHGRDIDSGIRREDAEWVVEQLGSETFQQAAEGLYAYNTRMLEWLRDAGVISDEALQAIQEHNQSYVPFYRAMDTEDRAAGRFGLGFGHLFSPVKRIQGSGRDIIDPLESIIKNTYLYAHLAKRQEVSQALARLAEREGAGPTAEQLPMPLRPVTLELGEVETKLREILGDEVFEQVRAQAKADFAERTEGMDPAQIAEAGLEQYDPGQELLMAFRPGDFFNKENVISVLRGGKRQWYEVDPELYRALQGLDRESLDAWVRFISLPAKTLRAGAVLAPEFLIRNPLRDQVMAFVQSEYGFKPGIDMARGLFSALRKDDLYWKWKASGGAGAALVDMDRSSMKRSVEQLVESGGVPNVLQSPADALRALGAAMGEMARGRARASLGKAGESIDFAIAPLQSLSALMENATRLGEYGRGLAVEGESKAGMQKSGLGSREVSTDFFKHGAKTAALRHMAAFWNARVQGYDRLYQSAKRNPATFLGRSFVAITLPSILLHYVNRDDPEYWEIPQWQRDLFWLVKIPVSDAPDLLASDDDSGLVEQIASPLIERGGHVWLRIPKPFELGLIFGTLPERILEWVDSEDPEGLTTFFHDTLLRELSGFLPRPTALLPLIENVTNYSFFLRRPIVPESEEDIRPEFQAGPHTSEVAKMLGRWGDVSPRKIDNLLFAWTGGLGRLGTEVIDAGVGLATDPGRTLEEMRSTTAADVPGVRGVVARRPGFSSESVERLYRRLEEATEAASTVSFLRREQRMDELEEFLGDPENVRLMAMEPLYRKTADALAKLRAAAAMVERSDMPAEERRRRVEEIGRQASILAREIIGRKTPANAATETR